MAADFGPDQELARSHTATRCADFEESLQHVNTFLAVVFLAIG
jgi:hypothetical protein